MDPNDINLYDSQLRTFGFEAFDKINSSSILIYGLEKGLATEISKNLLLMGVKNLYLYDKDTITESDLETGYFYSKEHVELSRSKVLMEKLQDFSSLTTIYAVDNYDYDLDVMIIVNQSVETNHELCLYCRSKNIKLIVLWSKGVSGVIFVDAGENHLIVDYDDQFEDVQIGQIDNFGKVDCAPNSSHEFKTENIITFKNLSGKNIVQLEKEWKITVINKTSFQLENFDLKDFTFLNGTCTIVKKPYYIQHQMFNSNVSDDLIKTFIQMYSNNLINKLPPLWHSDNFLADHQISLPEQAKLFHSELIPIVSIFGSLASTETIKLITNKYIPISQWFTWTDETLIPTKKSNDYQTTYGLFYGKELEKKLMESSWLLTGMKSISYEHFKNLSFMNVKNFIFIDQPKSENIFEMIKELKPNVQITLNKEITNSILSNITGVLNTQEITKKFIDEQCFKYGLPLFHSNTNGLKGNTVPVIPFVTDTLSSLTDTDQEKSFPLCVIKSFPNEIRHTIEFAREQFEFFKRAPDTMNKWLEDSNYLNTLEENNKLIAEKDINLLTVKYPTQIDGLKKCREFAIEMFNENYNESIIKLLESFPHDHQINENTPFWSNGKKCPKPIILDISNKEHQEFIEVTTELLFKCSGLSEDKYFRPIYIPQEFDYENDLHVRWIMTASNMRANNYSIPTIDKFQTKGIVGKIIPNISMTTSLVSGLVSLEILKYLIGFEQLENYKSNTVNLAKPLIDYCNPMPAPMIEIGGVLVNSWTKFEYKNDSTLDEFKKYYEKVFDTTITMMVIESTMIYAEFLDPDVLNKKLSSVLIEHFNTSIIPSNVSFNLLSNDDKDIPVITVDL